MNVVVITDGTAAMTNAVLTLDANPLAASMTSLIGALGNKGLPRKALFDTDGGDYPVVMAQNEGVVIQFYMSTTIPTPFILVDITWEEVEGYS
jgi:hypothetical protein